MASRVAGAQVVRRNIGSSGRSISTSHSFSRPTTAPVVADRRYLPREAIDSVREDELEVMLDIMRTVAKLHAFDPLLESQQLRVELNNVDEEGKTLLHHACLAGNTKLCAQLVLLGIDPLIADKVVRFFFDNVFILDQSGTLACDLATSQEMRVANLRSYGAHLAFAISGRDY